MSDLRIFCWGGILGAGLFAAMANRDMVKDELATPSGLLVFALYCAMFAVALFGKRRVS